MMRIVQSFDNIAVQKFKFPPKIKLSILYGTDSPWCGVTEARNKNKSRRGIVIVCQFSLMLTAVLPVVHVVIVVHGSRLYSVGAYQPMYSLHSFLCSGRFFIPPSLPSFSLGLCLWYFICVVSCVGPRIARRRLISCDFE